MTRTAALSGISEPLLMCTLLLMLQDSEKLSSLEDYVSRMKEDQKQIYYLSGEHSPALARLPSMSSVNSSGKACCSTILALWHNATVPEVYACSAQLNADAALQGHLWKSSRTLCSLRS